MFFKILKFAFKAILGAITTITGLYIVLLILVVIWIFLDNHVFNKDK